MEIKVSRHLFANPREGENSTSLSSARSCAARSGAGLTRVPVGPACRDPEPCERNDYRLRPRTDLAAGLDRGPTGRQRTGPGPVGPNRQGYLRTGRENLERLALRKGSLAPLLLDEL